MNSSERHPLFWPTTLAVLLHIILIALSMWMVLPGLRERAESPMRKLATFHMKFADGVPRGQPPRGVLKTQDYSQQIRFMREKWEGKDQLLGVVPAGPLLQPKAMPAFEKSQELADETFLRKIELGMSLKKAYDIETILLQTQGSQLKEKMGAPPKAPRRAEIASVKNMAQQPVKAEGLFETLQKPLGFLRFRSSGPLDVDPEEGMPGFTPASHAGAGGGTYDFEFDQGVGESQGGILKYESLDPFLDIDVSTYQDPKSLEKYFMIKIFAKKGAKAFKVMPKEILFTVDASLSISPDRLDEFKRGIRYCLTHLNKDDLFNIIAFKDNAVPFSNRSVSASEKAIKQAERFVSGLTSSQQTDVYLAFKKIVELPPSRVPSNVILISDGRPTHGLVDSREVIASITRINKKVRPIFAFSGGAKVNRYLLDFTAYQNRAWSQFIKKTFDIHTGFAEFYNKIKDPIFLNLRYRLNGLNENEVFPKSLPDFYVGAEFTLFGSYKDEDTFSMQLLGDVDGKTKELIFTRLLGEARKGSDEIMRGYAFNKIYYLISRLTTEGINLAILKQIEELSRRYKITTPYSPEIQKID